MIYEYRHVAARSLGGLARQLTALSQEGWEIEHINYNVLGMWDSWEVLLKREVTATEGSP